MRWESFNTYGDSYNNAFETLCNQLFERYLKRIYKDELIKFRVIKGAGGDGGIESYGIIKSDEIIAIQSKWFPQRIDKKEIEQIRKSITTAKDLRSKITKYIISIPHDIGSLKYGKGKKGESKKPVKNYEEKLIDDFTNEIGKKYPDLEILWWFENEIESELQLLENEGIYKFWFDKEIISINYLEEIFEFQKKGWLHIRYIPELHGQGVIDKEYQKLCFSAKYRKEFHKDAERTIIELQNGITLIDKFLPTFQFASFLKKRLLVIKRNIQRFKDEFYQLLNAIDDGNDLFKVQKIKVVAMWQTIKNLEEIKPNNIQKNILPALVTSLEKLYSYDLSQYLSAIASEIFQAVRLILGEPGTGKTHGLANCVDQHLYRKSPAIIIQAKGCPCRNWTEILSDVLNLKQWNEKEIFIALEALAVRNDIQRITDLKTEDELTYECSKVLICIDGLEEDIENTDEWYDRLRQSLLITQKYQRIKFIFSARRYFYDYTKVPDRGIFEEVILPREGDVPILKIANRYFNKEHYNIQIPSFSIIKGIDSLFALRLFCEEYKNKTILKSDQVLVVEKDLINSKINRINQEFCSVNKIAKIRNPVSEAMGIISEQFYTTLELEHDQLIDRLSPVLNKYLSIWQMDFLLDFLSNNGILIRFEKEDNTDFLRKRKTYYNIAYQSLIEHILIEKTIQEINNGKLNHIPSFLFRKMIAPKYDKPQDFFNLGFKSYNKRVVQGIIDRVFIETGMLIGDKEFLTNGFTKKELVEMRMGALSHAPERIALPYKEEIDNMFFGGFRSQFIAFNNLILPSSNSSDNYFGAEYLHQILIIQSSAFERDKLWSGLDNYEKRSLTEEDAWIYALESIYQAFDEMGLDQLYLPKWQKHNEKPLIYAWGLSTINQKLRNKLRIALTRWALQNPSELLLLLDKIFFCNDPQIQEDLSSVILGVASRLKNKKEIKALAEWALNNIFSNLETYRNVVVRQGFRAIIERAFQYGRISKEEVEFCRPKPIKEITLIPLDEDYLKSPKSEFYPIVHDLAWYVITKSYQDFLEYPLSKTGKKKSNDCAEAQNFLKKYWKEHNVKDLFAHSWAMAAAIGYIKSLGLTRLKGNGFTDATHGRKSDIFTYEEKYTWLAVHYLQGYLSDHIPMKQWSDNREFILDYTQITDIPNPAEFIKDLEKIEEQSYKSKNWVIKEILSKEIEEEIEITESLTNWVNEEPTLNFLNWLIFDSTDFEIGNKESKWVALYNHTALHDSNEIGFTFLDAKACLINKDDLGILIYNMNKNSSKFDRTFHLDSLIASPRTSTYCNPTDIVWMSWIEEDGDMDSFYDINSGNEKDLKATIVKIVRNTMDGEEHIMLPSKRIREIIGACELVDKELKDNNLKTVAFTHKISTGFHKDNQELVLVDKEIFHASIEKEGYNLIWIITVFKEKNPLNETLPKDLQVRRSRKYLTWFDDGELKSVKFWDEEFTNTRDIE